METYTIPQRMSGSGSIHSLSSEHCDREIKFPKGSVFAVVLADYYGGRGYTTHRTEEAAIKKSLQEREFSHSILDADGNVYSVDYDRLRKS